jgi:hypothetical protein
MAIGAGIGASFRLDSSFALPLVGALVGLALVLAPRWIRQKMIWQKAALPYLSRLASATLGISPADARALQGLLEQGAPPAVTPRQVLISGPIGSGRTSLTAGLGTEFAFRRTKVRYLTFDKFNELAQPPYGDYPGPKNIGFWPWRESQVVLIDDLNGALLPAAAHADQPPRLDTLQTMLKRLDTRLAGSLDSCHSVWVLGDVSDLEPWAAEIRAFCKGQQPPLVVRLQSLADGTADARGRW